MIVMAMMLQFLPVDFNRHSNLAVEFREDSYLASFSNADLFHEGDGRGSERYLKWLKEKASRDPEAVVHVWLGDAIIGQLELGQFKDDPTLGYVNLFYLKLEYRGAGYSAELHQYMTAYMKRRGFRKAMLSVSPTNLRAIRFYEKNGWKNLGPRPGRSEVLLMRLDLGCEEDLNK